MVSQIIAMKTISILFFLQLILTSSLLGQFTGPELSYSLSPGNAIKNQSQKATIQDIGLALAIPINLSKKNVLIFLPKIYRFSINYNDATSDLNVYQITPQITWLHRWNDHFRSTMSIMPQLSSDLKNINRQHWQLGSALLFYWQKNDQLTFQFGTFYSENFYGALLTPLIGLDWKLNKKFRLQARLPQYGTLDFALKDRIHFGLKYQTALNSYRIGNEIALPYFEQQSGDLALYAEYFLTKDWVIQGRFGHTLWRKLRTYEKEDDLPLRIAGIPIKKDQRVSLNEDIKNGFFFHLGIIYRVLK